jgi:hypothetical protein
MRYADAKCQYTETFENGQQFYVYTGPCVVTGKTVSVKVPAEGLFAYRQGAFIQDAFPTLSKDEREFLISGTSKEGWEEIFGTGEEETELAEETE